MREESDRAPPVVDLDEDDPVLHGQPGGGPHPLLLLLGELVPGKVDDHGREVLVDHRPGEDVERQAVPLVAGDGAVRVATQAADV